MQSLDDRSIDWTDNLTGSMSPYNIAGLISEVSEEVANQIAKNCRRQPPRSQFRPPPRGTPASIGIYLIFPETRFIGIHFCRCMYVSIFIQICAVGSQNASFLHQFAFWPFKVVQGHPRSIWFWYQSKALMRLPISRPLWLVLSCTVSEIWRLIG